MGSDDVPELLDPHNQELIIDELIEMHEQEQLLQHEQGACDIPVVKVSDLGWHVMSSSPIPLKTRLVGQRCTFNLSRAETSSRWCAVVVRRKGASSGVHHVPCPWSKITWSVAKSPRVAEQCEVNNHSLTQHVKDTYIL
ncbi:uncharacterized protein TNCV_3540361 [Trichonephila clavipes]|nr:uncharacterized protein TNCV_3540361 [Trichonephila clavipes]